VLISSKEKRRKGRERRRILFLFHFWCLLFSSLLFPSSSSSLFSLVPFPCFSFVRRLLRFLFFFVVSFLYLFRFLFPFCGSAYILFFVILLFFFSFRSFLLPRFCIFFRTVFLVSFQHVFLRRLRHNLERCAMANLLARNTQRMANKMQRRDKGVGDKENGGHKVRGFGTNEDIVFGHEGKPSSLSSRSSFLLPFILHLFLLPSCFLFVFLSCQSIFLRFLSNVFRLLFVSLVRFFLFSPLRRQENFVR